MVFDDSSTLTVGRNSSAVIDDFVYRGASGSQGVRLAKGVMRFVGGGVSHGAGVSLRTPTAVIGVRGGSVLLRTGGDCETLVVHQIGVVEVMGPDGGAQTLNRPGFGVCASESGVSEPFRVPPETIAAMVADMGSRRGQSGGARVSHSNDSAAALGDHAPASVEPSPGLSALAPVWAGGALVQSSANATNQPAPPQPRPAPTASQQEAPQPPSRRRRPLLLRRRLHLHLHLLHRRRLHRRLLLRLLRLRPIIPMAALAATTTKRGRGSEPQSC
ncbi:FecR domain-containing protein [Methylocystis sp. IM4]|uniref:FecR domain-containing protein n=1 Tax=Methylocystis sp. IM4 TaxID=3136560 RepID=UPI003119C9D3